MLAAAVTTVACASDADPADEAVELDPASATVEYHYQDSSVPPEYHRSYTLTVTQGEADLVVDSYGDVLHDETAPSRARPAGRICWRPCPRAGSRARGASRRVQRRHRTPTSRRPTSTTLRPIRR